MKFVKSAWCNFSVHCHILKAATLESKFPILSVEEGCILSKDADVTIGFKVFLPELFTVTSADYASMHGT